MLTELQPSWAVATPVTFVPGLAGHSSVVSAGAVTAGGVVSTMVIVCTQVMLFEHPSAALQVREITFVPAQRLLTESV
jgi:uncharacterized phosphosugar-binding protein